MSSLLAEGVDLFNAGRYWEAHEAWEREWTPDRKGSDSGFYKGLIQVAAGCLHYTRRNRRGALNIETAEAHPVVFNQQIVDVVPQEKNRATELIEDFMIAIEGYKYLILTTPIGRLY